MAAFLNLRFEGTDFAMMTPAPKTPGVTFEDAFVEQYKKEFGFTLTGRKIFIDDIRVRGTGKSSHQKPANHPNQKNPKPTSEISTFFEGGRRLTGVYRLSDLGVGDSIEGPAILLDQYSTILVEPGCKATSTGEGISIHVGKADSLRVGTDLDPIQLSIFSHRFMSIAEQMGRTLQRTAISTNIKERLDFSCALFGPDGGLVANAPHIPVHLGAMQEGMLLVKWATSWINDSTVSLFASPLSPLSQPFASSSKLSITLLTEMCWSPTIRPPEEATSPTSP